MRVPEGPLQTHGEIVDDEPTAGDSHVYLHGRDAERIWFDIRNGHIDVVMAGFLDGRRNRPVVWVRGRCWWSVSYDGTIDTYELGPARGGAEPPD